MNIAIAPLVKLPTTSTSNPKAALQHQKLVNAAQQFEGMMLQEMLKPMKEHSFAQGDGDDGDDNNSDSGFSDTLSSFGTETMATAIAKGGGLGIAKLVVEQVEGEKDERTHNHKQPVAAK